MSLLDIKPLPFQAVGPLVAWPDAFTPGELDAIVDYGDGLRPMKAEIAGREDNVEHLRITRVAWIENRPEIAWLYERLTAMVMQINAECYRYDLYGLKELFQYAVYEGSEGSYFGWHIDMGEKRHQPRKISLSLQLSEPSDYEGGDLVLEAGHGPLRASKARGTLIAFPSYVLHRVVPVTAGIRKSLVIWVAGPEFR